MTTAATSLLGLALPVTGELQGTWGTTVNDSITSLLDTAVAGTTTLSTDGDVTLSTTTLAANQARQAIILWTANGTTTRNITAPAQSKIYTVINASAGTQSIVLRGAGPTTGVTIIKGESAVCAWNGSDFIKISNTGGSASFTNVTVSGTTTLSGLTASTALALNSSKEVISVTNTGTGNNVLSASPTLTGTISAAALTLSSDLTLSGGTANGVLYLNGSKVATSGSALTFDGTTFVVGGTSSPNYKLASYVASGNNGITIGNGSNTGSDYAGLDFYMASAQKAVIYTNNNNLTINASAGSAIFQTGSSESMRLTSTGLGIGTSSPAYKLTVEGTLAAKRASANQYIAMSTTGGEGYVDTINTISADYIGFNFRQTNNAGTVTRAILDSSGNLGLGVTPSAWGTGKAFEVGAAGNAIWADAGYTALLQNVIFSSGAYRYVRTASAARLDLENNTFKWYTAASGTAGDAITFTQAMTLDASGSLLVGTTSQIASARSVITGDSGNAQVIYFNNTRNNGTGDATAISLLGSSDNNTSNYHYIGTTGGTDRVYIFGNGNIQNTNNSYGAISDSKLKENIVDASPKLADMMQVRVRNYNLIGETQKQIGVVAQELETVFPGMIDETPDRDAEGNDLGTTTKSVKYSVFVPMLIKAIQELKAEFDAYKASHP